MGTEFVSATLLLGGRPVRPTESDHVEVQGRHAAPRRATTMAIAIEDEGGREGERARRGRHHILSNGRSRSVHQR